MSTYSGIKVSRSIVFSEHAIRRTQQRGSSLSVASYTARWGMSSRVSGGLTRRTCTSATVDRLKLEGVKASDLEKAIGTAVITSDDGDCRTIVTVLPKNSKHPRVRLQR